MRFNSLTTLILVFALVTTGLAAPPIQLELATERGVQITAPQEWLQLLAGMGIQNVKIRGARPGDAPKVTNHGTNERPSFDVFGLITNRNQLQLPGGTFSRSDRARLKDYFDRLAADGAEALTAPKGIFGLTEREIEALFADLTQPIDFTTKGKPPRAVIDQLQTNFTTNIALDAAAERALNNAEPLPDELKGVTAGTGLAIALRASGLQLEPRKERGRPVTLHVTSGDAAGAPAQPSSSELREQAGNTDDMQRTRWPLGWQPHDTPGKVAPSLFEMLNAEIEGYSLAEMLAAITPRLKVPMYIDHAALAANNVDLAKVQVRLAKTRTSYKRLIDRALAQARLHSQIRIDEAGNPFLWITR